jgi:hypothetical protein
MDKDPKLKYRAFLSYSHADMRWANWLHRRLENFKIDKDLVGTKTSLGQIPQTLRPIFRDRGDFSGGQTLTSATIEALDASAALVLICSTNAANRPLVNEEVRLFRSRHPGRPVVPIIVDGVAPENFPPALRCELEPDGTISKRPITILAPDLRNSADGRNLALAKVVAGLLGLPTDEIFRRAERTRRQNARIRAAIAFAFVVLAIVGLVAGGLAYVANIRAENARVDFHERQARRLMEQGDPTGSAAYLLELFLDADGAPIPGPHDRKLMRALYEAYLATPESIELKGHKKPVSSINVSTDGSQIVTTSLDGTARVWSAKNGKELRTFEYHHLATTSASFSSANDFLAVSSEDGNISLWNSSEGSFIGELPGNTPIKAIAFDPTGTLLASFSSNYSVRCGALRENHQLHPFKLPVQA